MPTATQAPPGLSPQESNKESQSGLLRTLVRKTLLSQEDADLISKEAPPNILAYIASSGKISSEKLALFFAETLNYPLMDIEAVDLLSLPDIVDRKIIQELSIIPLSRQGNRLFIATADPSNQANLQRLRFLTQTQIDIIIVEYNKLEKTIQDLCGASSGGNKSSMGFDEASLIEEGDGESEETEQTKPTSSDDDAPIVRFLQKVLEDAIKMGASDVHFEPYEKIYRIRFRIDGQLRQITTPPLVIKDKLASRIKVLSRLNISEKRIPQDGRMRLILAAEKKTIDFRVSSLPTLFGEKIVMRILDPSSAKLGIEALGYEDAQKTALLEAIRRPYGMTLVTGPTGSGKTVSLYSCLNILNDEGTNISTAEDPAEINLPGINQVNVNDKVGLTFASALKSFLRQDPDIIMVGEIRDLETADISIKAAQTGHMVLSTLHTNDAPGTLSRLLNMGVAPFNIASAVILITAQRLGRRLCSKCKEVEDIPKEALIKIGFRESDFDSDWKLFRAVGCDKCNNGYKGRVGIYQVMPISEEIQKIILAGGNALQIAKQAEIEGVNDLRRSGLLKVKQGLTSIEEVLSVTNE